MAATAALDDPMRAIFGLRQVTKTGILGWLTVSENQLFVKMHLLAPKRLLTLTDAADELSTWHVSYKNSDWMRPCLGAVACLKGRPWLNAA